MTTQTLADDRPELRLDAANENVAPRSLESCLAEMRAALIRYAIAARSIPR